MTSALPRRSPEALDQGENLTHPAIDEMSIMRQPEHSDAARIQAANILLDRGWGRAPQARGDEDRNDIRVTIRKFGEGRDKD